MESASKQAPIILFDSECGLCNKSIQRVLSHDDNQVFRFAPLDSEVGEELQTEHDFHKNNIDSIIVVSDRAYTQSDAILEISEQLNKYHTFIGPIQYLPKQIRDTAYSFVATHRTRVFGTGSCLRLSEEQRAQFLHLDD